jgi:Phr family secreted Rap phosphatase inhibitor
MKKILLSAVGFGILAFGFTQAADLQKAVQW